MATECTIAEIIETLRNGRGVRGCSLLLGTLLLGTGCSKAAGIPLAGRFVEQIETNHGEKVKKARRRVRPLPVV